jgi:hypothetical protein
MVVDVDGCSAVDRRGLPGWVVSTLKWTTAIVALVVLVNIAAPLAYEQLIGSVTFQSAGGDGNDDDLPEVEEEAVPAALDTGEILATSDLAARNGTIQSRLAETIELGANGAEELLIGFEAVPVDTACLTEVTLQVYLVETTDAEIFVFPAVLEEIASLENGQALPPSALIEGSPPAPALATEGSSGFLRWDVTQIYTLAARSAPDGALVVLALTAGEQPADDRASIFATTDNDGELSPRLTWSAVQACSAVGTGSGVDAPDPLLEQEGSEVRPDSG